MRRVPILLALILGLSVPPLASAQEEPPGLSLSLSRTFGYGGGTRIQGTFTMRIDAPDGLSRVDFLIDDQVVHQDDKAPFEYRFRTGSFAEGSHTLSAVGVTADGRTIPSNRYQREFISAEAAWRSTLSLIVPVLVIVGAFTLLGVLLPALLGRGSGHRPGEYGLAGGGVCPGCCRPFSRHFWSPNLVIGKLERCPHCGKWSLVPRSSPTELEAAEARLAAERSAASGPPASDEEDRLRRAIEDSRYEA
jgi:hypothetical protein